MNKEQALGRLLAAKNFRDICPETVKKEFEIQLARRGDPFFQNEKMPLYNTGAFDATHFFLRKTKMEMRHRMPMAPMMPGTIHFEVSSCSSSVMTNVEK